MKINQAPRSWQSVYLHLYKSFNGGEKPVCGKLFILKNPSLAEVTYNLQIFLKSCNFTEGVLHRWGYIQVVWGQKFSFQLDIFKHIFKNLQTRKFMECLFVEKNKNPFPSTRLRIKCSRHKKRSETIEVNDLCRHMWCWNEVLSKFHHDRSSIVV